MKQIKDISGQKHGRWTVLRYHSKRVSSTVWECRCNCGEIRLVQRSNLFRENASCGCYRKEFGRAKRTHGMRQTRPYRIWAGIIQRCGNPNNSDAHLYSGRGISVCEKWRNFQGFWEDMKAGYSKSMTIDRRDNEQGYCKENCRWASYVQQAQNRRNNRLISFRGETRVMTEWERLLCFPPGIIFRRLSRGWTSEKALSTPPGKRSKSTNSAREPATANMKTLKPDSEVSKQCRAQRRENAAGRCSQFCGRTLYRGGACRECYEKKREAAAKWIASNPDRHKEAVKNFSLKNPDYFKTYYLENRTKYHAYQARYRINHGMKPWQPGSRGRIPNWVKEIQKL